MTNVTRKTTNRFTKGLVMDFSPENTKNEVLTNALNATLLTFNGNELSLQNDMGNARVETAYLPSGYIPVGTCEYGGIIYIVSYNPLENKSLIGCFPSPERVITREELGEPVNVELESSIFQDVKTGEIKHNTLYVLLKNSNLNPGDKFIITAKEDFTEENLADLWEKQNDTYTLKNHPILALNVVSIEDSGKIVYLNSTTRLYEFDDYKYHILKKDSDYTEPIDLDEYRNVLSSGYSVFRSKTSGKLAILAELIMIDSYSVTHSLKPSEKENTFDIIIHTDVSPSITSENYTTVPKLQYYYLKNSNGYLQHSEGQTSMMENYNKFINTPLLDIYCDLTNLNLFNGETLNSGEFNFPKQNTYHGTRTQISEIIDSVELYTKFFKGDYHRIKKALILDNLDYLQSLGAKFYYYTEQEGETYKEHTSGELNETYSYFKKSIKTTYIDAKRDIANKNKTLYKRYVTPSPANTDILKDTSIEKFEKIETLWYLPVTLWSSYDTLYSLVDGKYQTVNFPIVGETYYIQKTESTYKSIGYNVDPTTIRGTVYYYPDSSDYVKVTEQEKNDYYDVEKYPITDEFPYGFPMVLYYINEQEIYTIITEEERKQYNETQEGTLWYLTNYIRILDTEVKNLVEETQWFIMFPDDCFLINKYFLPSKEYNYIQNINVPDPLYDLEKPIALYKNSQFIPHNNKTNHANYLGYDDVKLASITLPKSVADNELDLPFKYDYTLVPCMNYGKLDHLKVSNTINFSNLHAFEKSKFNVWKYYISDELLRLTFGAEVFDTYEDYKVDGLILEFYDCWGFAGSLEITNKKSYSGVFTKTIPLNTINAVSNKQIIDGTYIESKYIRNINILPKGETSYEFNGKTCTKDAITGFKTEDGSIENDCGTLFSNIVYGVKTYFRKTTDRGLEFIEKDKFFLYTLPIFNDYYHNTENFATLENPGIDFILTYKLTDESKKQVYQEKDTYVNGYNKADKDIIDKYLSGKLETKEDLSGLTKYYLYTGTSNVLLEVGINKDYENLNMSCDPAINEHFSCTLELISDENSSVSVLSSKEDSVENVLSNLLNFENTKSTLEVSNIRNHNFINLPSSAEPIPINYNFVVGYNIDIINIRNTQVPATTICALCHEKDDGTWNYEDFGVYTKEGADGETLYLSNAMFYNEGDFDTEVFGVCRQVSLEGKIVSQLSTIRSIESTASKITVPGKLNSGEPLKLLSSYIGKLTFCQPHAHGFSEVNGVNVHCYTPDTDLYYAISPDVTVYGGTYEDDSRGLVPTPLMFNKPIYNLSLNTYDSIKYNSEFISTLDYNILKDIKILGSNLDSDTNVLKWASTPEAREFTGLTGLLVLEFNKKMVETMKYVYAYNPDYDLLNVNVGEAVLQNHYPIFTSNLISKNAVIDGDINDYIYLGPISFTNYLKELVDNSGIEITESVRLKPKLTYCGGDSPYLITSLTYNALVPKELKEELEFNSSDIVMVRHANLTSDGYDQLKGNPDKKVLYGFKNNKLIQLDVSNYSIDAGTGVLNIKDNTVYEEDFVYVQKTKKYSEVKHHSYVIPIEYLNACLCETSITLNDLMYEPNLEGHRLFMRNNLCSFDSYLRGKLFYRYLNIDQKGNLQRHESWRGDVIGNLNMNALYLYTGPCFKKDK